MSDLLARGRNGEPLTDVGAIDFHGHLGRADFTIPEPDAAALVATMDRVGVRSSVCSHVRCLYTRPERGNAEVFEATQAYPGRILGYVALVPNGRDWVRDEVERWTGKGFVGIKLHNHAGHPYSHPDYEPAFAVANERRMPVLFHTWGRAAEFEQIGRLAAAWPDASFVLGHAGSSNEKEYIRMARDFENVYLDTCLSRSPRGLVQRLVEGAGVNKVVWGTDATFLSLTQQVGKVLGARLSDADKTAVLATNAASILSRVRDA